MWVIEIKHNWMHHKWHRLSVRMKVRPSYIDALEYVDSFATSNNTHSKYISVAVINTDTNERIEYPAQSNAKRHPFDSDFHGD